MAGFCRRSRPSLSAREYVSFPATPRVHRTRSFHPLSRAHCHNAPYRYFCQVSAFRLRLRRTTMARRFKSVRGNVVDRVRSLSLSLSFVSTIPETQRIPPLLPSRLSYLRIPIFPHPAGDRQGGGGRGRGDVPCNVGILNAYLSISPGGFRIAEAGTGGGGEGRGTGDQAWPDRRSGISCSYICEQLYCKVSGI